MKKTMFERECVHREVAADGNFFNGLFFVQAIQRLPAGQAVRVASKVGSFYWTDAPNVLVWLCRECAAELRLSNVEERFAA